MAQWRTAQSLVVLRAEIDAWAPHRSKASDGTIGDPAHAGRCSRHNPNAVGVVCAFDCTHDPAGGCDVHALARRIAAHPTNPCLEYIVSNGQIAKRSDGFAWRTYTGSNPHRNHAHFAVGRGSDCPPGATQPYDDTTSWNVAPPPPTTGDSEMFSAVLNRITYLYEKANRGLPDPAGLNHWFGRYAEAEKEAARTGNALLVMAQDQTLRRELGLPA